jgi:hypothetical protein
LVLRDRNYNGTTPYGPYIIHNIKRDVTDYLRLEIKRRQKTFLHSLLEEHDKAHNDHRVNQELIDWVDAEAGYPLATWLSQGYTATEVAEMRGVTLSRISQQRKEMYAKARTRGLL